MAKVKEVEYIGPELIFALQAEVSDIGPIFKIAIFENDIWSLAKVQEVAHKLFFYHRGSKLSLLSL